MVLFLLGPLFWPLALLLLIVNPSIFVPPLALLIWGIIF